MTDGLHTYKPLPLVRHRWMDSAACASVGPYPYFPEGSDSSHIAAQEARAVAVCKSCPVQAECLAYALANDERYGVWAGMTPTELNARKGRRRPT